jgi:hypothetical protein
MEYLLVRPGLLEPLDRCENAHFPALLKQT